MNDDTGACTASMGRTAPNAARGLTRDLDAVLDGLLREWHEYRSSYRHTSGFRSQDATSQDYRTPGHMDWKNGAADHRADQLVMRAVDSAINRVPNYPRRWHTALEVQARNLSCGHAVWSNPLLPATRDEREVLLLEARNKLCMELRKEGTI